MCKRSLGFLISAAAFAVIMGFYLLRSWQWVTHSVALLGYGVILLLLLGLALRFRLHENRQSDTSEGAKPLSRSGSWLCAALITALFFGYVILMQWPYNDHAASLTAYAVVIVLFLVLALVARIQERKQQAA